MKRRAVTLTYDQYLAHRRGVQQGQEAERHGANEATENAVLRRLALDYLRSLSPNFPAPVWMALGMAEVPAAPGSLSSRAWRRLTDFIADPYPDPFRLKLVVLDQQVVAPTPRLGVRLAGRLDVLAWREGEILEVVNYAASALGEPSEEAAFLYLLARKQVGGELPRRVLITHYDLLTGALHTVEPTRQEVCEALDRFIRAGIEIGQIGVGGGTQ